jgi:DNA-3-methyladenine glycosylase
MFGPPGHAYIYLIYGMYHCLNFVTEPEGEPSAVLIRAVEPVAGVDTIRRLRFGDRPLTPYRKKHFMNGPGKVCQGLALTRAENRLDLTGDTLFVCDSPADIGLPCPALPPERVRAGPRIGVDYAEEARDFPWRFWLEKEI